MRVSVAAMLVFALAVGLSGRTQAAPTPMPGGANESAGVSGPISGELFNGKLRLKKMTLTPKNDDGDSILLFSTIISNGTKSQREVILEAHLVDADGVTIDQSAASPLEGPCALAPGAACRETFRFRLDDPQFKPVKVLLEEEGNGPQPVFRVML